MTIGRDGDLPPVAILAGGRATRLGDAAREVPKAMLRVAGRPFVEHQLNALRLHGARRVVLCVGHLGAIIEAGIGDGRRFGLEVSYSWDDPGLDGTAGALRRALPLLGERFLVLYGDTYLRVDYLGVAEAHRRSGLPGLMTVLQNRGTLERSNAVYADGRVVAYNKRTPPRTAEWIDYGLSAFDATVFAREGPSDLAEVAQRLAAAGLLAGYVATQRFYDIGTPAALAATEAFLSDPARRADAQRWRTCTS